ncbi:hypothetical protein [Pararhodospirillum photometricum]|uniref:hypothetical protein n=1 Tax=Pararhodospirillum photometricum TaxID=1084 RepID=UPI0012FEA91B|nr:hypothetical protein [Pararhodospirillum photometricum]
MKRRDFSGGGLGRYRRWKAGEAGRPQLPVRPFVGRNAGKRGVWGGPPPQPSLHREKLEKQTPFILGRIIPKAFLESLGSIPLAQSFLFMYPETVWKHKFSVLPKKTPRERQL